MNHSEQVAHLCRRVSFGSTIDERKRYEGMSIGKVTDELLDFSKPNSFPIHPFELFWDTKGNFQNQPQRVAYWWAMRMAFGDQPAKDKLLVFLHDHFAVSGAKVENGVLMLEYLQTLDANCNKSFADLLRSMTADPAMMTWLDLNTNVRGRPNENYAREVMELFTMGVGSGYTEDDVKQLARAFTGWSLRSAIDAKTAEGRKAQLLEYARNGWPLVSGSFAAGMHDPGPYEFLGKTRELDSESICDLLASDHRTALYLSYKLLEYYMYPDPEKKLVEKFAGVFLKEKGNPTEVVRAIVTSKEFYSDQAQRAIVKSPTDYLIPIIREIVVPGEALKDRDPKAQIDTPLPQSVMNLGATLVTLMGRMGMTLLYPPDVAGWNWGTSWISTSSILERIKLADVFTNQNRGRSASSALVEMAKDDGLKTNEELVGGMMDIFDMPENDASRKGLDQFATTQNLAASIGNLNKTSTALRPILRAAFSVPEFQMM